MVVGFTTTYAINTYHHWRCEFEPLSWRGELDTTFCDKVCQWLFIDWLIYLLRSGYGVCNETLNNILVISWQSVLLVEEIRVPGENDRSAASNWQTSSTLWVRTPLMARCTRYNLSW
jgi:hypothetical protein